MKDSIKLFPMQSNEFFDYKAYELAMEKYSKAIDRWEFKCSNAKMNFIATEKTTDSYLPTAPTKPPQKNTHYFVECCYQESEVSLKFDSRIIFSDKDYELATTIGNNYKGYKMSNDLLHRMTLEICEALYFGNESIQKQVEEIGLIPS